MSCAILTDEDSGQACLYCTTTDWAFGPLFETRESAEDFLEWLAANPHPSGALLGRGTDPREFDDATLERIHSEWRAAGCDDEGRLKEDTEVLPDER